MLSKKCTQCEKTIYKKDNCSSLAWEFRVKYCSVECSNSYRRDKPSCSPETTFKLGHKPSKLAIEIARKRFTGANNPKWKGGSITLTCKICDSEFEGKPYEVDRKLCSVICSKEWQKTSEYRLNMSEVHRERVKLGLHNLYRGITEIKELLRQVTQYKQWRESVFMRDGFKCQFCNAKGEMNADHIKPFAVILVENNVKTLDDALECDELWNIDNGRTLCVPCHKKTETYGRFVHAFINKKVEILTIKNNL